jgi:hypothetical protein
MSKGLLLLVQGTWSISRESFKVWDASGDCIYIFIREDRVHGRGKSVLADWLAGCKYGVSAFKSMEERERDR